MPENFVCLSRNSKIRFYCFCLYLHPNFASWNIRLAKSFKTKLNWSQFCACDSCLNPCHSLSPILHQEKWSPEHRESHLHSFCPSLESTEFPEISDFISSRIFPQMIFDSVSLYQNVFIWPTQLFTLVGVICMRTGQGSAPLPGVPLPTQCPLCRSPALLRADSEASDLDKKEGISETGLSISLQSRVSCPSLSQGATSCQARSWSWLCSPTGLMAPQTLA